MRLVIFFSLVGSGITFSDLLQVLSIKDADFSWSKDGVEANLEGINLSVKKGELLGLFGRVGAGKVQSNITNGFCDSS
jgi:ABC-type polysaccharide/polyol phosphate transport system ATPase subunit